MARWQPMTIVGGAYADDNKPWSVQDTVNYIPVPAEKGGTRSREMLRCLPGFSTFCDLGTNAPIRGARNVEGALFVVSAQTLFKVDADGTATNLGRIPGVKRCSLSHNQITGGNEVAISNGQSGYVYNTKTDTLSQITDEGFPGATSFDFVDGYILGIEPARRYAFTSDLAAATSYNTLDRYEAEGSPDLLVGQAVTHREWWLMGERTIEPLVNTGAATGTFQRAQGTVIEVGLAATHAVAVMDNSVFWLGSDGIVYRANGYTPQRISTHAIEQAIARCNTVQALAFTFEDRGHKVFYLTFPDGHTWGYDAATGEWHRRQSKDLSRWRINTLTKWNGMWIAGDFSNGKLYQLDWEVQDEDGEELERRRITGVTHDNQNALIINGIELVIDTGVGRAGGVSGGAVGAAVLKASGNLPDGANGDLVDFSYTVTSNRRPVVASITSGALPDGLTMDSNGRITGQRSGIGTSTWTVTFTDDDGNTVHIDESCVTTGFFALDPSTLLAGGTGGTISADNRTLTKTSDASGWYCGARAPTSARKTTGKFYIEYTCVVAPDRAEDRGGYFGLLGTDLTNVGGGGGVFEVRSDTSTKINTTVLAIGTGPRFSVAGQTVGIAVDCATGEVWWRNASGWNSGGDPAAGTGAFGTISSGNLTSGLLPYAATYSSNGKCTINFGQAAFILGDAPTGFSPGWGVFA